MLTYCVFAHSSIVTVPLSWAVLVVNVFVVSYCCLLFIVRYLFDREHVHLEIMIIIRCNEGVD
jgi:hypothetical protein